MEKRQWSFLSAQLAALLGVVTASVVDCGGRESTFEVAEISTLGGTASGTSQKTATSGNGGTTAGTTAPSLGGTQSTAGTLKTTTGGIPSTLSQRMTGNGGAPATLSALPSMGGTALASNSSSTSNQGGSSVFGSTPGGAGGVSGAGGRVCISTSGAPGYYGGIGGGGGQYGTTCNDDPDCCAYCAQQTLTAHYLDANCQPVSCAEATCLSDCWYGFLRGMGSSNRAKLKCLAQKPWTCALQYVGVDGRPVYGPHAPDGC